MPYQYDFPSNVSTAYNSLKASCATLNDLLQVKGAECRLVVIVDDHTAVRSLNISFNIVWGGGEYQVVRTFTAGSAMSNSTINTNMNSFINTDMRAAIFPICETLINL